MMIIRTQFLAQTILVAAFIVSINPDATKAATVEEVKAKIERASELYSASYWLSLWCPEITQNKRTIQLTSSELDKELFAAGVKSKRQRAKIFDEAEERNKSASSADKVAAKYGLTTHKNDAAKLCAKMLNEIKAKTPLGSFMKAN